MERFRIVYYNDNDEASEAIVDAESGEAALAQIEDMGKLCTAGLSSLGPAEDNPAPTFEGETPDKDVNEGDNEAVHEPDFPQELPSIEPGGEDS